MSGFEASNYIEGIARVALLSLVLASCVVKFRARLYPLPVVFSVVPTIPPVFQGGSHVCSLVQFARLRLRSARRSSRRSHAHSYASCKASALSLARFARCPLDWFQLLLLCSRRYLPSCTARVGGGLIVSSTFIGSKFDFMRSVCRIACCKATANNSNLVHTLWKVFCK